MATNPEKLTAAYANAFAKSVLEGATTHNAKKLGEGDGLKAVKRTIRGSLARPEDRASAALRLVMEADASIVDAGPEQTEQN